MRVLLIALFVLAGIVPASAADLKLLTAGAFKSVALEIIPEFEKRTGHKVTIDNDTAGGLSKLVESSAKALARAGIGVAVKQGAARPDLSSVDGFKKALLAARAIAYIDPA